MPIPTEMGTKRGLGAQLLPQSPSFQGWRSPGPPWHWLLIPLPQRRAQSEGWEPDSYHNPTISTFSYHCRTRLEKARRNGFIKNNLSPQTDSPPFGGGSSRSAPITAPNPGVFSLSC